jgi:hypothetical protein
MSVWDQTTPRRMALYQIGGGGGGGGIDGNMFISSTTSMRINLSRSSAWHRSQPQPAPTTFCPITISSCYDRFVDNTHAKEK